MSGKGSVFPLTQLAAKYKEIQKDANYNSNKSSIWLIGERIIELFGRLDKGDVPDKVKKLHKLWLEFEQYIPRSVRENEKANKALEKLSHEFEKEYHDYSSWTQLMGLLDLQRKMKESEVKILKDMKMLMSYEDGYELVAQVFGAVMRVIDDPKKLRQIQYEFTQITGDGVIVDAEYSSRELSDDRPGGVDSKELLDT